MADAILSGIYAITNVVNGKKYIGSACNLASRFRTHKARLNLEKHHSAKLQNAWRKYGPECFRFDVIELVEDKSVLIAREQFWIDEYKSATTSGYNVSPIAGSSLGVKHTEEAIRNMGASKIGIRCKPETREKIRLANTGKKRKPEVVQKMAEDRTGAKRSEETKQKMRIAHLGKKKTPETIANMSGKKKSPESIAKREATKRAKRMALQVS